MRGKINDTELLNLVDEGASQAAIAKKFGCSRQAVHNRIKKLRPALTVAIATKRVDRAAGQQLDAMGQLRMINDQAHRMLDELEHDPGLKVRVLGEIRQQLQLMVNIFEKTYSIQCAQEFQRVVLEEIDAESPNVRDRIIARLRHRHSLYNPQRKES